MFQHENNVVHGIIDIDRLIYRLLKIMQETPIMMARVKIY